jgi:hypothetical protein
MGDPGVLMDRYSIVLGKKTVWDRPVPSKPPLIRKIITGSPGTGKTRRLLDELCNAPEEKSMFVHLAGSQPYIMKLIKDLDLPISSHFFSFMFWDINSKRYPLMWDNLQGAHYQNLYLDSIDFGGPRSTIEILDSLAFVDIPKIIVNCDSRWLQEALGYVITRKHAETAFSQHISVHRVKWVVDNLDISPYKNPGVKRARPLC